MQDKVVFMLEVFDERVKRRAMKVVCDFPGVTLIDVKEKGKLKVTGEFNKFEMTKKLKKIYEYVDIVALIPEGEPIKNQNLVKKPEPKMKKAPSYRGWKIPKISFF